MKKLLLSALLALPVWLVGQVDQNSGFSCGDHKPSDKYMDPTTYEVNRAKELDIFANTDNYPEDEGEIRVIPIVFHIVHEYGNENISDAQVMDAVKVLNRDYQKMNSDTANVVPTFRPLIGNPRLEFRLAQKDPFGNCTNGIERIYSQETRIGDDGSKLHDWPRSKYLNVWVVKAIQSGAAGYAYYPSATSDLYASYVDGVMILSEYLGRTGTGAEFRSRSLTHEVGHYLGLAHCWGSTNSPGVSCGDDGIKDTPITKGWSECILDSTDICNDSIEENVENYMEYSYCSKMFTADQTASMRLAMEQNLAQRDLLWKADNLAATGVETTVPAQCPPIADFIPGKNYVCTGESVSMKDNSHNGKIDSWSWEFEGGNPATSSTQFPTTSFSDPGWHKVKLTVSNSKGSHQYEIEQAVYVSAAGATPEYTGWKHQDFEHFTGEEVSRLYPSFSHGEENTFIPFRTINGDTVNVASWHLTGNAGATPFHSMVLEAFGTNDQMMDEFITPAQDLSSFPSGFLTFRYSSATTTSRLEYINSKLNVYATYKCGGAWQLIGQITDVELANAHCYSTYFVPKQEEWSRVYFNIPGFLMSDETRFKFEHISGQAPNNIYIDDIGVVEIANSIDDYRAKNGVFNIFPNPATDNIRLYFYGDRQGPWNYRIYDLTGHLMMQQGDVTIGSDNTVSVDINRLPAGMYMIKCSDGISTHSSSFIKS